MEYAIQMLMILLICVFAGNWLDQKFGTSPWLTIIGVIVGMIMSVGYAYKRAVLLQAKQDKARQEKKGEGESP